MTVLVLGASGLLFGLFGVAGLQVALRLREVDVPDLAGQTLVDATETLTAAGLAVPIALALLARRLLGERSKLLVGA